MKQINAIMENAGRRDAQSSTMVEAHGDSVRTDSSGKLMEQKLYNGGAMNQEQKKSFLSKF